MRRYRQASGSVVGGVVVVVFAAVVYFYTGKERDDSTGAILLWCYGLSSMIRKVDKL
jgi:hypothetical protein